VAQLPYPQELGYIIVGQRIDPDDWRMTEDRHQRPAQEIADDVVRQAKNGTWCCYTTEEGNARRRLPRCH